jgi:hypothetical protein
MQAVVYLTDPTCTRRRSLTLQGTIQTMDNVQRKFSSNETRPLKLHFVLHSDSFISEEIGLARNFPKYLLHGEIASAVSRFCTSVVTAVCVLVLQLAVR